MIRRADVGDLSEIMKFAEPCWHEIQPAFPVHRGQAAATLRGLILSDDGLVSVLDDDGIFGAVVGACAPSLWTLGTAATCYLRWVAPERRGRWGHVLTRHFEAWASERGATVCGMSQTGREADGYYKRLGYAPAEMMYFKVF